MTGEVPGWLPCRHWSGFLSFGMEFSFVSMTTSEISRKCYNMCNLHWWREIQLMIYCTSISHLLLERFWPVCKYSSSQHSTHIRSQFRFMLVYWQVFHTHPPTHPKFIILCLEQLFHRNAKIRSASKENVLRVLVVNWQNILLLGQ